jgi:hypothetical protein
VGVTDLKIAHCGREHGREQDVHALGLRSCLQAGRRAAPGARRPERGVGRPPPPGAHNTAAEIMANNKRQHTQKSALGVLSPQDLLQIGQGAVLDVEVTPPAQDGSRNGTLHLWSSSYPAPALDSPHAQGGANFTQSFTVLPHEEMIDIRALVDHSSVEAFVMRGRAVISLAVVPNCTENQFARDKCAAGQVQAGVSAQSQTGATLSMACMSMHCMWVSDVDSA